MEIQRLKTINLFLIFILVFSVQFLSTVQSKAKEYGSIEKPYSVIQAEKPVRVDGKLDDQAWAEALVIELPFEVMPGENITAPVKTECLVTYDETNLYIAFRAYDPEPSKIRVYYADRDTILGDDCVGVTIDTFNDERRAYDFFSSPFGVQFDAIDSDNGTDTSWDGIWDSAGRIYEWGYAVEMAIPFNQLRFQRKNGQAQIWGLDADRRYPRNFTHVLGAFPRDRNNNCYLCQLVKIEGFEGVSPGHNVEITPTVTAVRTDQRTEIPAGQFEEDDPEVEAGLTARWGVTPNLTLNGTLNPDFSQVEADSFQLDINETFTLYYEEKRPFFNEGRDFFKTPLNAIYTRAISDPSFGLKLSGKEGNNTIGFYLVQDDLTNLIFPGNQGSMSTSSELETIATIVRYKYDFGTNYTVGALFTDREGEDYYNRVLGIDGNFRFTQKDRVQFQFLGSMTDYAPEIALDYEQPLERFSDHMIFMEYVHSTRSTGWWFKYQDAGADFRADLGFIPMVDYRHLHGGWNYIWNALPGSWWSRFTVGNELNYYEDQEGELLNKNASLWLNYQGTLQSYFNVSAYRAQEVYDLTEFDLTEFNLSGNFKPAGNLWLNMNVRFGDRIDYANSRSGERVMLNPALHYKFGEHVSVDLNHTYEDMRVQAKRLYIANISQSTIIYQFNQRTFLRAILQYIKYDRNTENYSYEIDSESEMMFSQFLFSYKINPRTVLFLGYSDGHSGSQDYDLTQVNRTFFTKIGYAWVH
ncbi:DUF5916 domain-containing protein [candidate division CSSED10-310 bacterium]|uniref:DUF5916 domain-containing protein n=1 Tax=candidate division CSSED10-310 bacterium TaxID=2855610 RepID=A0ABV6YYS7_UNCC1